MYGGGKERQFTPKGHMAGAANQKPPLMDLPPMLQMMFENQRIIETKPPVPKRVLPPYSGIAKLISFFETEPPPKPKPIELPADRKKRERQQREELNKEKNDLQSADWDPHNLRDGTENAYTTMFVGRLSYDTTEKKLRREFERYGQIKKIKVVQDLEGKPRGYAFVEFANENDMTSAVRRSNGIKLDGRRIVVDVERGRTVKKWRPRRFGGGLEGRKPMKSKRELELEAAKAQAELERARAEGSSVLFGAAAGGDRDRGNRERSKERDVRPGRERDDFNRRDGPRDGSRTDRGGPMGRDSRPGRSRSREPRRDRGGIGYGPGSRDVRESRDRGNDRYGGGGGDYRNVPPPSVYGPGGGQGDFRAGSRRSRSRERKY